MEEKKYKWNLRGHEAPIDPKPTYYNAHDNVVIYRDGLWKLVHISKVYYDTKRYPIDFDVVTLKQGPTIDSMKAVEDIYSFRDRLLTGKYVSASSIEYENPRPTSHVW